MHTHTHTYIADVLGNIPYQTVFVIKLFSFLLIEQ